MTKKRLTTIGVHILAWVAYFLIPVLGNRPDIARDNHPFRFRYAPFPSLPFFRTDTIFLIVFFYLNLYLFIPRLLRKDRSIAYGCWLLATGVIIMLATSIVDYFVFPEAGYQFHFSPGFIFNFLLMWAVSFAYSSYLFNIQQERIRKEQEVESLRSTLLFLRSQISPHFIFNVLNVLVALTRKNSPLLEPTIIKLSNLLRYMLYDTDADRIAIRKELGYINDYVELQKLRVGDDLTIQINLQIDESELENLIEPMLIIPLVENAFKHGVGLLENPEIDIDVTLKNKEFMVEVKNKVSQATEEKYYASGIGLTNLRKRLDITHTGRYALTTKQENDWYIASLKLRLND